MQFSKFSQRFRKSIKSETWLKLLRTQKRSPSTRNVCSHVRIMFTRLAACSLIVSCLLMRRQRVSISSSHWFTPAHPRNMSALPSFHLFFSGFVKMDQSFISNTFRPEAHFCVVLFWLQLELLLWILNQNWPVNLNKEFSTATASSFMINLALSLILYVYQANWLDKSQIFDLILLPYIVNYL